MNRLPAGGTLLLPAGSVRPSPLPLPSLAVGPPETEKTGTERAPFAEPLLGIIRPVITRMRGTVTLAGSHYIPIEENTQITVDCAQIPVVEMDDGTTVLLDYGNHLSENLKRLIHQVWNNYAFLTAEELRGELGGLPAIVGRSENYTMARTDKAWDLTDKPEILLRPDWIIRGRESSRSAAYRQMILLLDPGERPLPAEIGEFLGKSGIALTEISGGRAAAVPEARPPAPAVADLRDLKGIALAERILILLGERPVRNAEFTAYDQARNGYNLSVTADLLVRRGEKRFILLSKGLPDQFLQILRESGTEAIPIGEKDSGRTMVEGMLRTLGIPVSFGHFSFRIPEGGQRPRLTGAFSTLRAVKDGEPVYLIDFDMPSALLPFLNGGRGGRVVRY